MTTTARVLSLISDNLLRDELERIAAAVGIGVVHLDRTATPGRQVWTAAAAVVLDETGARRCADALLPRRAAVFVIAPSVSGDLSAGTYQAAVSVGAQLVADLPAQAGMLVAELSRATEGAQAPDGWGEVVTVIGGRGGAGASAFATALAQRATDALLVDLDPWSGGIDLLVGAENVPGLRWPDLAVRTGRLTWAAVRDALPRQHGISVLSAARGGHDLDGGAVDAVLDAGRRGGVTVVCDLPRSHTDAVVTAIDAADIVVVITPTDVRSCASSAAMMPVLTARNPNVGLVVRGPSPGGLRAGDVADIVGLPVLATMRPEPLLAQRLDGGPLRLGRRSPMAVAASRVLALLGNRPGHASDVGAERAA